MTEADCTPRPHATDDVSGYARHYEEEERAAIQDEPPGPPRWPSPASVIEALGMQGPKLPTNVKPIDTAWRGGIRAGKVWTILGTPGAGKTSWCAFLMHQWAKQGVPVVYIAADEAREDILIRIGQQIGLNRQWLEDGLPTAKGELAEYLRSLPIMMPEPGTDEPKVTVTSAAEYLRGMAGDGPGVLIIDSLQQMARALVDPTSDQRMKTDKVIAEVRSAAKKYKIVVLLISEMNRGAYRRTDDTGANGLAAGKDSGGIEYNGDAQCTLYTSKEEPGLVTVEFDKARMGRVDPFTMRQNFETATFAIAGEPPPKPKRQTPEERRKEAVKAMCDKVLALLSKRPDGMGAAEIRKSIGGTNAVKDAAMASLVEQGVLLLEVRAANKHAYVLAPKD